MNALQVWNLSPSVFNKSKSFHCHQIDSLKKVRLDSFHMEAEATQTKGWELDLVNASFLTGIPILAAIGMVWYTMNHGISMVELGSSDSCTSHVGFQSPQATTVYSLTGLTKQSGHCGCFTLYLALEPSKILPSSGAVTTDVTISSPILMMTLTAC